MSSNRKICWVDRPLRLAVVGGLALVVASCGTKQPPPPRPITVLPSAAAALTPALYMSIAGDISLYAVRASEIAIARSADERTRALARGVLADQTGVASQLSMAGRRVNLLPDAALTPLLEEELDALRRSGDVDRDYRRLVATALAGVLDAHETFARAGTSATLRPVAAMAAPVTRKNLDAVRR